jgi:hypothetical protein
MGPSLQEMIEEDTASKASAGLVFEAVRALLLRRSTQTPEAQQLLTALLPSFHTYLSAIATKPTVASDRPLSTVRAGDLFSPNSQNGQPQLSTAMLP